MMLFVLKKYWFFIGILAVVLAAFGLRDLHFWMRNRVVGERHLKLRILKEGQRARTGLEAMRFNSLEPLPARVRAAYRLGVNDFNGLQRPQITIEAAEPA